MAQKVSEIMNRELFTIRPAEPVEDALSAILALGITGAPVVDDGGGPLGLVSLRDLVGSRPGRTAGERMTYPAATISAGARIETAARKLSRTGYHRLVVVDEHGLAAGMVSSLDVIRGLLGLPAPHPASFPHLDRESGLSWTDDLPFELQELKAAPAGPGLLVLVHGGAGVAEQVVWAESPQDVRGRLKEILTSPQPELLASWVEHGGLRFRAASAPEQPARDDALARVLRTATAGARTMAHGAYH